MKAVIGLGTNLGDRNANIARALYMLNSVKGIGLLKVSSVLETAPVDFLSQPHFLNCMAVVETSLSAEELLSELWSVENALGRVRTAPKGPRTIDLDIILYGEEVIFGEELTVPHKERLKRPFILRHLAELLPDTIDPLVKRTYRELLDIRT